MFAGRTTIVHTLTLSMVQSSLTTPHHATRERIRRLVVLDLNALPPASSRHVQTPVARAPHMAAIKGRHVRATFAAHPLSRRLLPGRRDGLLFVTMVIIGSAHRFLDVCCSPPSTALRSRVPHPPLVWRFVLFFSQLIWTLRAAFEWRRGRQLLITYTLSFVYNVSFLSQALRGRSLRVRAI